MNDVFIHSNKIVTVDLKKVVQSCLTVEEYFFAHMLFASERYMLDIYIKNAKLNFIEIAKGLIQKNYVQFSKYDGDDLDYRIGNLEVTQEFLDLIHAKNDVTGVESWIDKWYALWPTGIKSGGYYLKTDKKGVLKKMKDFVLSYPEFGEELIMKATENYLLDQSLGGFSYTKLAPYFIMKDGMSVLAGECENIEEGVDGNLESGEVYGSEEL